MLPAAGIVAAAALKTKTMMSSSEWNAELKCSATGRPGELFRLLVVVVKIAPNNDENVNQIMKLSRVNYAICSKFEIWKKTFKRARNWARYDNILILIHCRAIFPFVTRVKLLKRHTNP